MAAKRRTGTRGGRASIDWQAAFVYYAAIPAEQRTYRAVADRYRVSVRTVERHGMNDRWNQRARELDVEATELAAAKIRDRRTETLADIGKLAEASLIAFATQLRSGKVRISVADLTRLHKLYAELWTDRDDLTAEPASPQPNWPLDPTERKLQVLRALNEAGAFEQLLGSESERSNPPPEPAVDQPVAADGAEERER